jgi:hypothetical protein
MSGSSRVARAAAVLGVALAVFAGCADDDATIVDEPTAQTAPEFDPPLPNGVNALPYVWNAQVGLGTWKIQVREIGTPTPADGDGGKATLDLVVWIENGALQEQIVEPEAFVVYDTDRRGGGPVSIEGADVEAPLASAESAEVTLRFEMEPDATPSALVFLGTQVYGGKALDAVISLDPDFVPVPGSDA